MFRALIQAFAVTSIFAGSCSVALADDLGVPGHLVLAKPGAKPDTGALLIWDATPVIVTVVTQKLDDATANAMLERDAIMNVAKLVNAISPDATTVTLRVTYQKIGAVNPEYGAQTFAGVERYALLRANAGDLRSDKDKWMQLDAKAQVPPWLGFSITGSLPPRH